jgi:hypothetical protein
MKQDEIEIDPGNVPGYIPAPHIEIVALIGRIAAK